MDEAEVASLAALYLADGIIPAVYQADALHAAYATVSGSDVPVTFNFKRLANEWASCRLNAVNMREGYPLVSIRTPEGVISYED